MPPRKCSTVTLLGLFVFILVIGYSFITIQDAHKSINLKSHEIVRRRDHENVLKEQLKVVYNHAQRVEDELKKERERHKQTRQNFSGARKDFITNLTNSKHEAWTRFKSLDSDHKMLKAEHEETKISYTSLQAQHKRLSADHQRIIKQNNNDYASLKELKDRESLSLQDRVQELYKKAAYYQQLSEQQEAYSHKIKEHYDNCTKLLAQNGAKPSLSTMPKLATLSSTFATTVKSLNNNNNNNNKMDEEETVKYLKDDVLAQIGNHRYVGKANENDDKAHNTNNRYKVQHNGAGVGDSVASSTTPAKNSVADDSSLNAGKGGVDVGDGLKQNNRIGIDIPQSRVVPSESVLAARFETTPDLVVVGNHLLNKVPGVLVNQQALLPPMNNKHENGYEGDTKNGLRRIDDESISKNKNKDDASQSKKGNGIDDKADEDPVKKRADVKKVTLEDDEVGDQNLDSKEDTANDNNRNRRNNDSVGKDSLGDKSRHSDIGKEIQREEGGDEQLAGENDPENDADDMEMKFPNMLHPGGVPRN